MGVYQCNSANCAIMCKMAVLCKIAVNRVILPIFGCKWVIFMLLWLDLGHYE